MTQKSAGEVELIKKEISDLNSKIKAITTELDTNFSMSTVKIREKKREMQQFQTKKNGLEK